VPDAVSCIDTLVGMSIDVERHRLTLAMGAFIDPRCAARFLVDIQG